MSLSSTTVPLSTDQSGVMRVGETRVSLDSVVFAFNDGATPEEIVQQYTTLNLADVYAVVSYYLQHPAEVEDYLERRGTQRLELRKEVEARFDPRGIRERLLARERSGRS
ncbi:MAG: DUF433 domain-containing protein [Acidobacteria bacterium]|nr:DUF433 domain-containing protein [Acidobacteriota bacterium]